MTELYQAEHSIILIASRQEHIRHHLQTLLAGANYQLALTEDAAHTLALTASSFPDLVLFDTELGVSAIEQLKCCVSNLPLVLALVDENAPHLLDESLAAGADDTVLIPIHDSTLLRRLYNLLATRPARLADSRPEIVEDAGELFAALFEQSPDAILLLDAHNRTIIECNRAACQMNGYTRDELIGQSIDLLNAEQVPIVGEQDDYVDLIREVGELRYETVHRRKDGSTFPIEVTTSLIQFAGKEYILGIDRDISQRKLSEITLKSNEESFRLLTQYTTDMITRHAQDGTILFASPASEILLGYMPQEMVGKSAYDFVHPSEKSSVIRRHKNLSPDIDRYTDTYRAQRKDGTFTWFETTSRRIRSAVTNEIEDVISVSRDISDRKAVEASEQEQHLLAEALGDAAAVLKSTLKTDEALDAILEQAARVVPYDSASITLIEDDIARVVRSRGFAERGLESLVQSLRFDLQNRSTFFGSLLRDKLPVVIDNVHDYPDWIVSPGTEWIHSNLTVPVIVKDTAIGFLHLDNAAPAAYTHEQARRLQTFADQVAIAIQTAQLYDELRALYHATSFLFTSFDAEDLSDLAKQIVQAVVEEYHKIDCGILLVEPEDGSVPLLARAGEFRLETYKIVHKDGPGLIAESIRTGQVIYAPDVALDSRYFSVDERTRSELVLPLRSQGAVIGALDLQSPERDAFTPQDRRVLEAFAERAATAIQNLQYAHELELRVVERTSELRQTNEQVEAILNNSSDAIIVTYIDGTIRRVNPAFNTLFGYQPGECVGKPLTNLVPVFDKHALTAALDAAAMESQASRIEVAVRRHDGSLFDADLVISPILEQDRHALGLVVSVRDISERKRIETELRKALEQERELSELKSRFVMMASHEFRTPLAMIMTASELIQKYSHRMTDEQKNERLERIQTEVKYMARLIDNVLTVNKSVEAAALEFDPMPLNLVDFCNHLLDEIRVDTNNKRTFRLEVEGEYTNLYLDQKFMRDILNNLLWNAVKYSVPPTEIKLSLICGAEQTVIMIEDQGIGIPEEDHKRLFEAFHRGKNVGNVSGTGLGLALARQAAELHGGTITFNSQLGIGSTFVVTMPTLLVEDGSNDNQDSSY